MREPSHKQIDKVKQLLVRAISSLERNDSALWSSTDEEDGPLYSDVYKAIDRKLHEVTINHRLAYYIETLLLEFNLLNYCVDIEYNRFYESEKRLETKEGVRVVRPDIVVHSRRNRRHEIQHYLVVEAKKGVFSMKNIDKVKSFIKDSNYNYLFETTISYASQRNNIVCRLYYFMADAICCDEIN